jgi:hypothetical protein
MTNLTETLYNKDDELFVTENEEIRDWFVNFVFTGKTIAEINKMSKAELDALDAKFDDLMELINANDLRVELALLNQLIDNKTTSNQLKQMRDTLTTKKEKE